MEMSQGNSLCSYLKQTKSNFFSFFYKIRKQECGAGHVGHGWYKWDGGGAGERAWEDEYSSNSVCNCM
jgi:hypothetical protein